MSRRVDKALALSRVNTGRRNKSIEKEYKVAIKPLPKPAKRRDGEEVKVVTSKGYRARGSSRPPVDFLPKV